MSGAIATFAAEVGSAGPIRMLGGDTHELVGGPADGEARVLCAPSGIVEHQPADMTVRVRAGTTLETLQGELALSGQRVVLDGGPGATVGGVLAVGRSGVRRRGDGHVRDAVLGAQIIDHTGAIVTIGGGTVKNVAGYDLCRLMVGALGTLGCLAEVILRCLPIAARSVWVSGRVAPAAAQVLHRPTSVLWDGAATWALVEGAEEAVADELRRAAAVGLGGVVSGPPALPPHRWSSRPGRVAATAADIAGPFVAEIGVGVIHAWRPSPTSELDPMIVALHQRIRDQFDPARRFNPGRDPLAAAS